MYIYIFIYIYFMYLMYTDTYLHTYEQEHTRTQSSIRYVYKAHIAIIIMKYNEKKIWDLGWGLILRFLFPSLFLSHDFFTLLRIFQS